MKTKHTPPGKLGKGASKMRKQYVEIKDLETGNCVSIEMQELEMTGHGEFYFFVNNREEAYMAASKYENGRVGYSHPFNRWMVTVSN